MIDVINHVQDIKMIPIGELKPHPKNPNSHPDEQISRLAEILKYQGWRYPIKVSARSGFITSGHGRLLAAKRLGLNEVPVSVQHYESDDQEYADIVADNAVASWSELDMAAINAEVGNFDPSFHIDLLGIEGFVLDPSEKFEPQADEDDVPEKAETRVKLGDIWQLGRHRLMCGDSTSTTDLEKLMDGELADMWLTDPPYGVAYKSKGTDKHDAIANDAMPLDEMKVFWQDVATNAFAFCSNEASYYWFACQGGDQMMMMMMMSLGDSGWQVKHELIWLKDRMVLARCDYHYKHEPIIYGWKRGGTHHWYSDRKQVSVLEYPRPKSSDLHPTMKPVELVEYLMGNNSAPGQLILETFGGSGTTLIAAEKSGRRCNAIELSPKYCDVILARWERYTGKKAERIIEGEYVS